MTHLPPKAGSLPPAQSKSDQLKHNWLVYSLIAYALSVPAYVGIVSEGNSDSNWVYLLMFMPTLAVVAMRYLRRATIPSIGWKPGKPLLVLGALLIPLAVETLTIVIAPAIGVADLKPDFFEFRSGQIDINGPALLFGTDPQPIWIFLPNFVGSFALGSLLMLPLALGEEIGWRGYLQQTIIPRFGIGRGVLLLGLIWGYWHMPGILIGHNFPNYPVFGAIVLMPIGTIAISVCFGFVYQKSRSIWLPALFHSSINTGTDLTDFALGASRSTLPVDLIWLGLWTVCAVVMYVAWKRN